MLERQAYIIGTPDGYIRPGANITRAEISTIFFRLLPDEARAYYWLQSNPFSDVNLWNWFNNAVSTTTNAGIFAGYPDGTFGPNQTTPRAEMTAAIVRFMGALGDMPLPEEDFFDDISGHWARGYINTAAANNWIQGPRGLSGSYYPERPITRAETAAIVNRIFGRLIARPEDVLDDMLVWPDNSNINSWYYFYIQSATNAYTFEWRGADNMYERWLSIIPVRNWATLEKPDSRPWDILHP